MLILRVVFWLAIIAMILPAAPGVSPQQSGVAQAAAVTPATTDAFDAGDAVSIVVSTGSDVLSFCERNEAVCDTAVSAGAHVVDQVIFYSGEALSWATQELLNARQADGPAADASAITPATIDAPAIEQGV